MATLNAVENQPAREAENANDRYERLAAEFYADTGMMAPGKDDRLGTHTYEARVALWTAWLKQRSATIAAQREAAIAGFLALDTEREAIDGRWSVNTGELLAKVQEAVRHLASERQRDGELLAQAKQEERDLRDILVRVSKAAGYGEPECLVMASREGESYADVLVRVVGELAASRQHTEGADHG